MEDLAEQRKCYDLKKIYDETETRVITEAKIRSAYINKVSADTINEKVNNQLNSIKTGIYRINPKFKEGSKNFDKTKTLVTETLAGYEQALIDLSEFYDGKIDQLIMKKVELEADLIGSILDEQYFSYVISETENRKANDEVKKAAKGNFLSAFNKLINRKKEHKTIDPYTMNKLIDSNDITIEVEESITEKLERVSNKKLENKEVVSNIEKEIARINGEIERLNDRKKQNIYDAMEVGDKSISTTVKGPKIFTKITRFFMGRINTASVVENTIIDPLRLRIESFKNNELSNIQG